MRDKDKAEAFAERWSLEMCESWDAEGLFCFIAENEYGSWPTSLYNDEGEPIEAADIFSELTNVAEADEIIIVVETGAEKARYLIGCAIATHSGDMLRVSIDDIYALAEKRWGAAPSRAEW